MPPKRIVIRKHAVMKCALCDSTALEYSLQYWDRSNPVTRSSCGVVTTVQPNEDINVCARHVQEGILLLTTKLSLGAQEIIG